MFVAMVMITLTLFITVTVIITVTARGKGSVTVTIKGNDNGKVNGDVTWRSRRGNDVSIFVATHHVSMTVTFFSL